MVEASLESLLVCRVESMGTFSLTLCVGSGAEMFILQPLPRNCMYVTIPYFILLLRSVSSMTIEWQSTSPRGSSFLGGEDDDTEDIKNHIKATRALLTPNLKHTVGYWGDWM